MRQQAREYLEYLDANETELPFEPVGWRNLWICIQKHRDLVGIIYPEGFTMSGEMLHPSKEAAEARARWALEQNTRTREFWEYLGAFEVNA